MVLTCDMCEKVLLVDEDVRYVVRVEGFAAYDPMEVASGDLARDLEAEMRALVERMRDIDPETLEARVYKAFRFDLCPACHAAYLKDPLGTGRRDEPG